MIQYHIKKSKLASSILAVLILAAGTLPFLLFREQVQQLSAVGYIGLFLACLATNASVFLPANGIAFTIAASAALDPLLCAVVGGLGTACGEVVGYFIGRCGHAQLEDRQSFQKVAEALDRYGNWAIFVLAFLPIPLFDLIGIAAGTAGLRLTRFFLVCCIGKIGKMLLYVFVIQQFLPM